LSLVYLAGVLGIAASGGGGGGDDEPTVLDYSGNTDPAVISESNAARLVGNVLIGQTIVDASTSGAARSAGAADTSVRGIGIADLPRRLTGRLRAAMRTDSSIVSRAAGVQARTEVDETEPCDNIGGTLTISGFIDDDGSGTLTLEFVNCREDGETLDGEISVQINAFDFGFFIPVDAIYSASIITLTSSAFNVSLSGSIHSRISVVSRTEHLQIARIVARNNATGEMIMITDQVSIIEYDDISLPSSLSQNFSGRIYDSIYGYVDFTTVSSVIFSSLAQDYPDGGQLLLTGSSSSQIRVSVISATHAAIELDLDGDSSYEAAFTLGWAEIEDETELVDTDGDGMHDSWEQANSLDPLDPADAAQDRDGDGFSNYQEYLKGTSIDDSNSFPDSANLAADIYSSTAAFRVNEEFRYTVTAKNSGPDTSPNTIVNIDLSPGVALVTISFGSGWDCSSQGSTITCTSDAVNFNPGDEDSFELMLTAPSVSGDISTVVTVIAQIIDPNPADNSATATNPVGISTAGLQSRIDAAPAQDTILVPAGLYVGCLDFAGKDVNLQSIAGARETILSAFGCGAVVTIGPDGAIDGFTITDFTTRGLTGFGPGIEVNGAGSSISRNIFENNNLRLSSSGTAIDGNNAAPVIERNIFRNITCDGQSTSGAVAFINSSAPTIVNNVFDNNRCRGINMQLPAGNAPLVVNNTLVDNDVGIRVDRRVSQVSQIYRNNVIVGNGIGLEVEFGSEAYNPVWENNLLFANTTNYQVISDQTGVSGNLSSDPLFVDAGGANYRLQAGSPAIDTGSSVDAPAIDFDATPRPLDGDGDTVPRVDIGAFEAPSP
jgi:uncharacterized repeat protein (TIGR01451 family)